MFSLRTAARWADQWNYPEYDPDDFRRKSDVLDAWCDELGRDPSEIERSIQTTFEDLAQLQERVEACLEAGAEHVVVYFSAPHDPSQLEPVAEVLRRLA